MASIFPHPLCDRVVTVYRKQGAAIHRHVFEDCCYAYQDIRRQTEDGVRFERTFLLIVPGDTQAVSPGDRIFDGEGPEVTLDAWDAFLPVSVPGLSEAEYARVQYFDGKLLYTEAGRK